ncbi:hypothetical protein BDV96DRAFT_644395 [Lophiotrema nucula]|uniref:Fungal-specific transcription factor domain-containing protein n=1 Tax=Lophiotrema nucula TaxID=690887 RepID=A0A6A5ZGM4_9PLEO|nr:hypothetical protein BDV96DRAFT_644395 [Lophiotrema nucula]
MSSHFSTEVTFAPLEDDAIIAYTRKELLRGGPVDTACRRVLSSSRASKDPGMSLLRDAMLSLSTIFFGKQHKQPKISNRGYHLYGAVLARLNLHLAQSEFQTTNETILTVLTCNLLEIFLPTGKNNFLKHIRGLETILTMRGPPEQPLSDEEHTIFTGLRLLLIVGGLTMSTPTIYARDRWKALPSKTEDDNGQVRRSIMNILADCTCLRSTHDAYIRGDFGAYQFLIDESKSQYERLEILHPIWVAINKAEGGDATPPSGKAQMANQNCATTYMLYNTTVICLMNILNSLKPSPRHESLRTGAALRIAKCLEWKQFQRDGLDAEGNTIGFVAVRVAWTVLGGFETPEGRKLARVVRSVVNDIFAVGAWEGDPAGSPRIDPGSPDRIMWVDDVTEPW